MCTGKPARAARGDGEQVNECAIRSSMWSPVRTELFPRKLSCG